jgi:hypothetical protein
MWSAHSEELPDVHGLRFAFTFDSRPASVAMAIAAWRDDAEFRSQFNALLTDCPYTAFRWETPRVTVGTVGVQPFEFVLLDSPGLARRSDPGAFAEHFRDTQAGVVTFRNLGGDAVLIVPCPLVEPSAYGHLAAFVRLAPELQRQAVWQAVGEAMAGRLGPKPVWLSTAGGGVSWLHVRLDDRPKYYGYAPYRQRLSEPGRVAENFRRGL